MKKFKIVVLFFASVFLAHTGYSQTCMANSAVQWQWPTHSNWFFGNGIKATFPSGNGAIQMGTFPSDNLTYEGTAAISDENGVLKYYSNGNKLWKANGTLISSQLQAGNENGATQGSSAVNGVLFVKHPLDNTHLYIFTVDDYETSSNNWNGLNYRVLDMTNDILSAAVNLKNASNQSYRTTEQLAATFHANGTDVWITTRESSFDGVSEHRNIFTYKLTSSGIQTTPVVSLVPASTFSNDLSSDRGSMKFSWDGSKAATVNYIGANTKERGVIVYDFNNATGVFSNAKAIGGIPYFDNNGVPQGGHTSGTVLCDGSYDCEFSPDNNRLYVVGRVDNDKTVNGVPGNNFQTALYSFDLTQSTVLNINLSAQISYVLPNTDQEQSLKLGGDGKLYMASYTNSYIHSFSGNLNTASLTHSTVSTASGRLSQRGFPHMFIPASDFLNIQNQNPLAICSSPVNLGVNWLCKGTSAEDAINNTNGWSGVGITDAANGIFNPASAGVGTHQIIYTLNSLSDTITITVATEDCVVDTVCPTCITFTPMAGKKYVVSAWVAEQATTQNPYPMNNNTHTAPSIQLTFMDISNNIIQVMNFTPSGNLVGEWQKIESDFVVPAGTKKMKFAFVNSSSTTAVYFDDFRIHPFNASMVSYVYNQETMQLQAQLDENNFYTVYIYDEEGNLVKTTVETIEGVRTAAETRSNIQRK